jgi:aryl-alcohol dehydrogenase-like predicted oxidoreductase
MQLAGRGVFGPPRDPDAARAVLRRAIELGVDHIDTSQYYGPDVVNDLIRETLHPYPTELKLVTKVGAKRDDKGAWLPALAPAELRAGVEANLRSLRVERMDLVNLRVAGPQGGPSEPTAEQLGTLEALRQEGKLDLIGVSNVTRAGLELALEQVELGEVQNSFGILDRAHDDLVDLCAEREIAFVPFFPLGSAFGAGPRALAENQAIAGRARLAPRPLRADAADSGDDVGRPPRGEPRGRRPGPRRRGPRGAQLSRVTRVTRRRRRSPPRARARPWCPST